MATFTLPKNSKVKEGVSHDNAKGADRRKSFKVYRYDPDKDENPRYDTYTIDLEPGGGQAIQLVRIKS